MPTNNPIPQPPKPQPVYVIVDTPNDQLFRTVLAIGALSVLLFLGFLVLFAAATAPSKNYESWAPPIPADEPWKHPSTRPDGSVDWHPSTRADGSVDWHGHDPTQ